MNPAIVGRQALVLGVSAVIHAAAFLAPSARPPPAAPPQLSIVDVQIDPPHASEPAPDPPLSDRTIERPAAVRAAHAPALSDDPRAGTAHLASASPIEDSESMPHFTIAIGGAVSSGAVAARPDGAGEETPLREEAVDVPARLTQGDAPTYPAEARAEGIEADVKLEIVVSTAGTVETVRALRRDGYGLDEAAIGAARRFRFAPAVKNGRPVRVRVSWTVQFRLT